MDILHFSDTHGIRRVLSKLEGVARRRASATVVLCTGDCGADSMIPDAREVPREWDSWPQRVKLAVPGNHDHQDTFIRLRHWKTKTPWFAEHDGVSFIGLDTAMGFDGAFDQLERLFRIARLQQNGPIVFASHQWPSDLHATQFAVGLQWLVGSRPLLVCHGHDHPAAPLWDPKAVLGELQCARSHVCSCEGHTVAHLISWNSQRFECAIA